MKLTFGFKVLAAVVAIAWPVSSAVAGVNMVQNPQFLDTTLTSPGGFFCELGATCTSNVADWSSVCAVAGECGTTATVNSLLFPGTNGVAFNNYFGLSAWVDPPTSPTFPVVPNIEADDGDPYYTASISQTIDGLTPGQSYLLTFLQAGAQQAGGDSPTSRYWQVSLGSQTQNSATMSLSGDDFSPWALQQQTFKAGAASELLTFMAVGTGSPPIALLTDVSLTPSVPEPAVWTMLILGFSGLGLVVRQRRRAMHA